MLEFLIKILLWFLQELSKDAYRNSYCDSFRDHCKVSSKNSSRHSYKNFFGITSGNIGLIRPCILDRIPVIPTAISPWIYTDKKHPEITPHISGKNAPGMLSRFFMQNLYGKKVSLQQLLGNSHEE